MDLQEMATYLNEEMQKKIPYDNSPNYIRNVKHKGRNEHIRNVALQSVIPVGTNGYSFDIGSEYAEQNYPYYHILEDAQVIHKRDKGTKQSKGSQSSYSKTLGNRDYGKWSGNVNKRNYDFYNKQTGEVYGSGYRTTKSVYQEYRKNVRGSRSKIIDGQAKNANTYVNIHYHYIERALDEELLESFANKFGLKQLRTKIDLSEELKEVFGD